MQNGFELFKLGDFSINYLVTFFIACGSTCNSKLLGGQVSLMSVHLGIVNWWSLEYVRKDYYGSS